MTPQELKASILQLAIQGKLVEQRPEEGTGAELLEKIARNGTHRTTGTHRTHKTTGTTETKPRVACRVPSVPEVPDVSSVPPIPEDEKPFDIPESWVWVRLGEIVLDVSTGPFGSMLHKADYCDGGIPLVNPMNIQEGRIVPSDKMRVSKKTAERLSSYRLSEGMVVVARRGELGRCASVGKDQDGWLCGTGSFFLNPSKELFVPFITLIISSPYARQLFAGKAVGTTMANLNHSLLKALPFPLPPLAEQKRIVAKIEELLPYIDRYEKAWSKLEDFNKRFPGDMQKSLLQMAIQGKLVDQRPEEGTGAELLEKILAAKGEVNGKRGNGNGKSSRAEARRRGAKAASAASSSPGCPVRPGYSVSPGCPVSPGSPVPPADAPFDIPESWVWVRFLSVVDIATNLVSPAGHENDRHIAPDNIEKGTGRLLECRTVAEDKVVSSNHRFFKGQLIYSKIRPLLRKIVIAPFDGLCSADMYPLDTQIDSSFLLFYILSDAFNIQIAQAMSSRVKMPKINQEELSKVLIPLPPLAEQKRIVAKLEELLPLCERLK